MLRLRFIVVTGMLVLSTLSIVAAQQPLFNPECPHSIQQPPLARRDPRPAKLLA